STLQFYILYVSTNLFACVLVFPQPDDQMSLVMVMLYDLQERKFLPRKRGNSEKDRQLVEVREVEICLSRTRLAASLARCRIKRGLRSLDDFLSEPVKRRKERANALPLYAWVNRLKTSLRDVCSALERGGFSQVKSIGQLEGPTFCQDPHCPDLLAFRAHLEADLYAARLFGDHKLLVQDKCRSLALSCLRPLLTRSCHVLVAGYLSVSTVTQAAMLASSDSAQSKIFVHFVGIFEPLLLQPHLYSCESGFSEDFQYDSLFRTSDPTLIHSSIFDRAYNLLVASVNLPLGRDSGMK
uniref:NOL1/NOP2/NSUN 5/7 ferredoxin-like domain-containing protein n=1 Tax=Scleropages formosus TaxID=113540 RepID=A0A8C9RU26_SCLFO